MHIQNNRGVRVLKREGAHQRGERGSIFPLPVFERAILSKLAEIDPREVLGHDEQPDETEELAAQLARLDVQNQT